MGVAERVQELAEEIGLEQTARMVETFLSSVIYAEDNRLAKLQAALKERDADAVARESHTLRGSCSNFEAERVAQLCHSLEQQVREGDYRRAEETLASLEVELKRMVGELLPLLAHAGESTTGIVPLQAPPRAHTRPRTARKGKAQPRKRL